ITKNLLEHNNSILKEKIIKFFVFSLPKLSRNTSTEEIISLLLSIWALILNYKGKIVGIITKVDMI
ncbi:MAG: hypothetical protein ACTSUG_17735, partial [Candidatus Helarchaeota archaeon]